MKIDERLKVFCSPVKLGIFHAVTHQNQIWQPDPYDVEIIHKDSRECYQHLLNHNATENSGRILLLLGDSGAGKTHLMRALRSYTHEHSLGHFAYMQMSPNISQFSRYVLSYTIDSLNKEYCELTGSVTGLMHLSNAVIEGYEEISQHDIEILRGGELNRSDLSDFINRMADKLMAINNFRKLDINLIRVMLYLQTDDYAIHARVFLYLRCENLSQYDCDILGGINPLTQDHDPQRMLESLASLMMATNSGTLVICLDELENVESADDPGKQFRSVIQSMIMAVQSPNVIVVISCLSTIYHKFKNYLPASHVERIEKNPEMMTLTLERNSKEIQELIVTRLQDLYDSEQVKLDINEPVYPFPSNISEKLSGLKNRDVLHNCRKQREQSIASGQAPMLETDIPDDSASEIIIPSNVISSSIKLDQQWNDHLTGAYPIPGSEHEMIGLLSWSIKHCEVELNNKFSFKVSQDKTFIDLDIDHGNEQVIQSLAIGLCQKKAIGGGLYKQIEQLQLHANTRVPIAIRSLAFPSGPRTKIAKQLGEFIKAGGQKVIIASSDWHTMVAMQAFKLKYAEDPEFLDWLKNEQPLLSLPSLQQILNIVNQETIAIAEVIPDKPTDTPLINKPPAAIADTKKTTSNKPQLTLGIDQEKRQSHQIETATLLRHAAFLGGSGSGKTTLALNIIEQLLQQGIPAILLDRKGDLCSYAQDAAWTTTLTDSTQTEVRDDLRSKIEVVVYTPGAIENQGRRLNISIAPDGIGHLPSGERLQLANYAAFALGNVMGYRDSGAYKTRQAILGQAIAVISEQNPDKELTLDGLIDLIANEDPLLVNAIGKLDPKLFKKLVEDLQTLSLTNGTLFDQDGERLNAQKLFGLEANKETDKTRLSIISLAALGSNSNILFWVAQLLLEINRYAKEFPSDQLQAVILFDEADLYLPAQSKPATKEPLEGLLKRARSAGIGMMLATQSPADLDYKSRDQISSWFVGKVKENTALNKLSPMLREAKTDVTNKLSGLATGEFYAISDGEVCNLKANLSLVQAKQIPADEILELANDKPSGQKQLSESPDSSPSFLRRLFGG